MFNITILFKVYYIRKSCIFVYLTFLFVAVVYTDVMSLYTTVFKNQIIYFWNHIERKKKVLSAIELKVNLLKRKLNY